MSRPFLFPIFFALVAIACGPVPGYAADRVQVSSFSTILTELAEKVGGGRVEITAHVKPGVDPHEYEPKPRDLESVAQADVVLLPANHMEGFVGKLRGGTKGRLVEVGVGFEASKGSEQAGGAQAHSHQHGHAHDSHCEDPHWWHSIACMKKATRVVRDALSAASPADKTLFAANASRYMSDLDALLKWAKAEVAQLPRDKRVLVSSHDAFQYLAPELGFRLYAVEGISSGEQPSAKRVSEIIALIKKQGVKAIFAETIQNPKVLKEITRETGAVVGGELAADGLGHGETGTFEGMYRHNINTIVSALK